MKFEIKNKKLSEIKADVELTIVTDKSYTNETLGFKGENEEVLFLNESQKLYIAIDTLDEESIKIATSKVAKILNGFAFETVKVKAPDTKNLDVLESFIEGFLLGSYAFDKYKSKKQESSLKKVFIAGEGKNLETAVLIGPIKAEAVNFTRDIVNSMPDELTPNKMAKIAKKIAKENELDCAVYDDKYLEENGYNLFHAVSRASVHEGRLIHLAYRPKKAKRKIVIVGKGLTYDSGGLSLKPANYMVTMKADKSGASAVLGIMSALKALELDVEVHGIIGAAENMIGGNAYKPDDVFTAKNGKTVEIRNTDAEGRLVLADCLCYAQENIKKIDYIFDFATLTGACVVALGEYTSGLMGYNDEIKERVITAGSKVGELYATLPFNRYLSKLLKSEVADISNISSSRYGGAITAGLFLSEFIEEENKEKWTHIDIAGPAYVEKPWGFNPHGASGVGVNMMLRLLYDLQK